MVSQRGQSAEGAVSPQVKQVGEPQVNQVLEWQGSACVTQAGYRDKAKIILDRQASASFTQ